MAMKKAVAMLVAVAVAVAVSAGRASAVNCDIAQLAMCKPAVTQGARPTAACCSSLQAQEACLCTYQKDPKYGQFVCPNARKMVTSCGMAIPNC